MITTEQHPTPATTARTPTGKVGVTVHGDDHQDSGTCHGGRGSSVPCSASLNSYPPASPPGVRQYLGEQPRIEVSDEPGESQLLIPLDAPSWIILWAFREVKRMGWQVVSPTEQYREMGGWASLMILPSASEIIRTPIQTKHFGVLESLSVR